MRAPLHPTTDADDEAFFAQPGIAPEIVAGQIEARVNKDFVRLRPDGTSRTVREVQAFVREQAAENRAQSVRLDEAAKARASREEHLRPL